MNRHFPLPGQIGATNQSSSEINAKPEELPHYFGDPLTLLPAQPCERHLGVLAHYLNHELKVSLGHVVSGSSESVHSPSHRTTELSVDVHNVHNVHNVHLWSCNVSVYFQKADNGFLP